MTTFRTFLNGDPPALADLWNRALPDRAVVRPLTPHEFDALVMGKLGFDRRGLIVAEDSDSGRILGFAHAGFGPEQPRGPSHRPDRSMGAVVMLVTEPGRDDADLEMGLFLGAERYLRSSGAEVFYAGGQAPINPFYWGLYGGSEFAGVLGSHAAFLRAATRAGYRPASEAVLFEADLAREEPRNPRAPLLRRQARLEIVEDARLPRWWDALAVGLFHPTRFELTDKLLNCTIATAWTWDVAGGSVTADGRSRTGLIDLEVLPEFRRKGFGRHLVAEVLRHVRLQNTDVLSVQTSATNAPALALYNSLGFEPVDSATLYRLPAELAERSRSQPR